MRSTCGEAVAHVDGAVGRRAHDVPEEQLIKVEQTEIKFEGGPVRGGRVPGGVPGGDPPGGVPGGRVSKGDGGVPGGRVSRGDGGDLGGRVSKGDGGDPGGRVPRGDGGDAGGFLVGGGACEVQKPKRSARATSHIDRDSGNDELDKTQEV